MPRITTALHMLAELMPTSAVVLLKLNEALHTMHRYAAAFLMLGIAYVGYSTFQPECDIFAMALLRFAVALLQLAVVLLRLTVALFNMV